MPPSIPVNKPDNSDFIASLVTILFSLGTIFNINLFVRLYHRVPSTKEFITIVTVTIVLLYVLIYTLIVNTELQFMLF
jgi:hypothetical protein